MSVNIKKVLELMNVENTDELAEMPLVSGTESNQEAIDTGILKASQGYASVLLSRANSMPTKQQSARLGRVNPVRSPTLKLNKRFFRSWVID